MLEQQAASVPQHRGRGFGTFVIRREALVYHIHLSPCGTVVRARFKLFYGAHGLLGVPGG